MTTNANLALGAALAEIVFADPSALRDLESITHLLIEERTARAAPPRRQTDRRPRHALDRGKASAENYDAVVVVDAPVELRVQRLIDGAWTRRTHAAGSPPKPALRNVGLLRISGSTMSVHSTS